MVYDEMDAYDQGYEDWIEDENPDDFMPDWVLEEEDFVCAYEDGWGDREIEEMD